MSLPGALAAFEFRGSGELLNHETTDAETFTPEVLDLLAHMCAANSSIAAMQARGWEGVSDLRGFYPVRESVLFGLDWSVISSGANRHPEESGANSLLPPLRGMVMDNERCDYEAAFTLLEQQGGAG
jgi:roadblock/LC7 domain-containing protein